jgi:hypothetical protein
MERTKDSRGHAGHCKPVDQNDNDPFNVDADSCLLLWKAGTELVLSRDKSIIGYKLIEKGSRVTIQPSWRHKSSCHIVAITSLQDSLVVVEQDSHTCSIGRLDFGKSVNYKRLTHFPGSFKAIAPRLHEVILVVEPPDAVSTSRLVRLDCITGRVTRERALQTSSVDLQTDALGTWLTITDRSLETVTTVPATLDVWSPNVCSRVSRPTHKPASLCASSERSGCGICGPLSVGGSRGRDARVDLGNAACGGTGACAPKCPCRPFGPCVGCRNGENGGGIGTPNDPISHPGTGGTPSAGGGTYVGTNGGVSKEGGQWGTVGCSLDLLWRPHKLVSFSSFFVAQDQKRRNVAVISKEPFGIAQEYQDQKGFFFAADRTTPKMLLFRVASRQFEPVVVPSIASTTVSLQDVNLLDFSVRGFGSDLVRLEPRFPLEIPDTATFTGGVHTLSLMANHAPTFGPIDILLVPFIERSQTFGSANMNGWAAFMQRTMAPKVQDYYFENSFGNLREINFHVFGSDIGVGGPVQLPRNLSDYYYPDYVPAKLTLSRDVPVGGRIVFDGRETLKIIVQPDGGIQPTTLDLAFPAVIFELVNDFYPLVLRFNAGDTLKFDFDDGTSRTINFAFKEFRIQNDNTRDTVLNDLARFLDQAFLRPDASRQFAAPAVQIVPVSDKAFGRLVISVSSANTGGSRLGVSAAAFSGASLVNFAALAGSMDPSSADLKRYLESILRISNNNSDGHFTDTTSRTGFIDVAFSAARVLQTTVAVGDSVGGPTATINLDSSARLDMLFTTSNAFPNSATTRPNRKAVRDWYQVLRDALDGVVGALGQNSGDILPRFPVILLMPVEQPPVIPGDVDSVLAAESWTVSPLSKPIDFRGWQIFQSVQTTDPSRNVQAVWALVLNTAGFKPDVPTVLHELGHGLGFRDLYFAEGYRNDIAYFGDWAMMDSHLLAPHHCGYHKWQAGWIPDTVVDGKPARVITIPPSGPGLTVTLEALLVPVEVWDDAIPPDARSAFGVADDTPVVQLVKLDLGGDGVVFDLIEARQKGARFSQNLPPPGHGILVSNAYVPWDDQRYSFNNKYRREAHLLNPNDILTAPGHTFDFANASGMPFPGIVLTIANKQTVHGADVYHIQVTRTNKAFVDLYFAQGDPFWRSPDIYLDWPVDNLSRDPRDFRQYPVGQPLDQGEAVHVPRRQSDHELHWLVARIRNKGGVKAEQVVLDFQICDPGGAGDGGNFRSIGSTTIGEVPGGDLPAYGVFGWQVPAQHGSHICAHVQIKDFRIPVDSGGSALATDDTWFANNHCQKNVTVFVPLSASPYDPVDFEFSVNNDGIREETAYLEPENLPYGATLTVTPRHRTIAPKQTVVFRCKLQLDDQILDAGCKSDRQFRLNAWRRDPESSTKWGGVQYKVLPRKKLKVSAKASWGYGTPTIAGTVDPNPGGGRVRLFIHWDMRQLDPKDPYWVTVNLDGAGTFGWAEKTPPEGAFKFETYAVFEGNLMYGPAESEILEAHQEYLR